MKRVLQILSALALVATIAPACIYLSGGISLAAVKTWMVGATILWFITVPLWMDRKDAS